MKEKKCVICNTKYKPSENYFHKRKDAPDGLRNDCKICRKNKNAKIYNPIEKECSKCKILKPNNENYFHKNKQNSKSFFRTKCIECANESSKENNLKRYYNIDLAQYIQMCKNQHYKCLICEKKKKLFIDHYHKTNKVRGLLCDTCNRGIGLLHENVNNFKKAIDYILINM